MAQLVTTKEKYGVSVAARIPPELAHAIMERAENLGISFAKMVGMLISRGFDPQEPFVVDNHEEIEAVKNSYRSAIAEFIKEVSTSNDEYKEFAETFNRIYEEQDHDDY